MMDPDLQEVVRGIKEHIDEINQLIEVGWGAGVEIRINYVDKTATTAPKLNLWRATQSIDYLVNNENGCATPEGIQE